MNVEGKSPGSEIDACIQGAVVDDPWIIILRYNLCKSKQRILVAFFPKHED